MKIILAGGGRAGLSVAVHLSGAGHAVTLIDKDGDVAKLAFEAHGIVSLTGDGTDPRLLAAAEVDKCDVVVAMLPRDADNLAVAALSKRAGAKRIMVRVKEESYRALYAASGVDRIISETDVFIGALATAIEHESVRTSMFLGNGTAVAFELTVPPDSHAAGRTVSSLATSEGFPTSCVFAGIYDASWQVHAPRGGSVVDAGATILLVARRSEISTVIDFFMRSAT